MIKKISLFLVLAVVGAMSAFAVDVPPLDLASSGIALASLIAAAAGAALVILIMMYGINLIKRAFKSVGK